jgi:hypothetical protein
MLPLVRIYSNVVFGLGKFSVVSLLYDVNVK